MDNTIYFTVIDYWNFENYRYILVQETLHNLSTIKLWWVKND